MDSTVPLRVTQLRGVVLVGCGFVGSLLAEELVKRAYAFDVMDELELTLIDDDSVDSRNPANQNFTPNDVGDSKAAALCRRLMAEYGGGNDFSAVSHQVRWQPTDTVSIDHTLLVISAVDNLATRQALWLTGKTSGVPVLQVGLSPDGWGRVEWTQGEHDTFSLSPIALQGQQPTDPPSGVTPPCQLVALRLAGHCVAVAAAHAITTFLGCADPERWVPDGTEPGLGTMLTSMTHPTHGVVVDAYRVGTLEVTAT